MRIPSFLHVRSKPPSGDIESHAQPPLSFAAPADPRISRDTTRTKTDPTSPLATFRLLTGITSDFSIHPPGATWFSAGKRPAPNVGIMPRVIHNEQHAKDGYKMYAVLINSCLGLQIIVAASLTAMGAGNVNHVAVTAFGAVNTIIAGFLTFLKGSGLPNRLKYYRNEWKKLREYIEQREREFISHQATVTMEEVQTAVHAIEAMYEEIQTDIEANTPDAFVSAQRVRQRLMSPGKLTVGELPDVGHGMEQRVGQVKQIGDTAGGMVEKVGQSMNGFNEKAGGLRSTVQAYGNGAEDFRDSATTRVSETAGRTRSEVEERMRAEAGQAQNKFHGKVAGVEESFVANMTAKVREVAEGLTRHKEEAAREVAEHKEEAVREVEERRAELRDAGEGVAGRTHGAIEDFGDAAHMEVQRTIHVAREKL